MKVTTYKTEINLRKLAESTKKAPIRLRITKDRKTTYRTLLHVEPEYWDEKNECIKKKHPNFLELNSLLQSRIAEYKKEVTILEITDDTTCMAGIRSKLNNSTSYDFYEQANKVLEAFERDGQYSSYKKYKSVVDKLRRYSKGNKLSVGSITTKFIKDYEHYLLTEINNNRNTVNVNLKVIARIVNDIYKSKKLNSENNPFKNDIKLKRVKPDRPYLEAEEVKSIEKLRLRVKTRLYDAKEVFLIECYTGLRISDILNLRWKDYNNNQITVKMRKTDKDIVIPASEKVKNIFERRKAILEKNNINITPDKYIFNILSVDVDKVSKKDALNAISSATAIINKNLKEIAKRAEIQKNLSTHIGRHTFATTVTF